MPPKTARFMSAPDFTPSSDPESTAWLQVVERKVAALRFGSVQIVVHEGRVTQIESTEKFRLPTRGNTDAGGKDGD